MPKYAEPKPSDIQELKQRGLTEQEAKKLLELMWLRRKKWEQGGG